MNEYIIYINKLLTQVTAISPMSKVKRTAMMRVAMMIARAEAEL
tara:strand:- start:872 stop:1003 length:132 start_codon:yes stop_codon:yes gene_type:complete